MSLIIPLLEIRVGQNSMLLLPVSRRLFVDDNEQSKLDFLSHAGWTSVLNQALQAYNSAEGRKYALEAVIQARTDRLFDAMRDYPQSNPAIDDLSKALALLEDPVRLWRQVSASIATQIKNRLLIPGAHTKDILKMYIRSYKAATRLVGNRRCVAARALIQAVANPIVAQLLRRSDSIRCVVSALLGEDGDEGDDLMAEDDDPNGIEADEENSENEETWLPPPLKLPGEDSSSERTSMVSLLVGVFGGRDKFLSEFKTMLSGRLLSLPGYDCEREFQSLELMKLKFGEEDLTQCQVMLRDVVNSKRVNNQVHQLLPTGASVLTALIISRHFWPSSQAQQSTSNTYLPPALETLLAKYSDAFRKHKPAQRLSWRRDEGVVTLAVTLKGQREQEFRVNPKQAAVLSLFENGEKKTIADISTALKISGEESKRLVNFWSNHGILREVEVNTFRSADN